MCEKCKPIDDKITYYKRMALRLNDQQTLEGIARLIQELEAQNWPYTPTLIKSKAAGTVA
jgi:hypothetical protein